MKFSLEWLGDFVDVAEAGGASGVRKLLAQAGLPVESVEQSGSDTILDVEITPNRPDAMSHRGLAREVAAMAGLAIRAPLQSEPAASGPPAQEVASVEISVPRLCRRFGARVIRGVSGAPSPESVRARLAAIGAKSIGAAVDTTNYVLWEMGQPLHAFDLDRLRGGGIVVRRAKKGERLVTLDGVERQLLSSDIVVADAERAVSLAGILGGLETAVTSRTRNVLLEAAWWDPVSIRRTSRRLGLHTDASHRFERGADPEAIPEALADAARILLASAGGTLAPGWIDARGQPWKKRRAVLRLSRLRLLAGTDRLDLDFAAQALERLGFVVSRRGKRLRADVPSFRPDVALEDDLVEEVLRVYGYEQLSSRLPPATGGGAYLEPLREVEDRLTDGAVAAGLFETVSNPFVNRENDEGAFSAWLAAAGSASAPLRVSNPLDDSRRDLRATLLPGLLDAVARNVHQIEASVALFEVGRVFDRAGQPDDPASFESRRFAFALSGDLRSHWSFSATAARADFFDAKGLLEGLLSPWLAPATIAWKPFVSDAFAPGAAALLQTPEGAVLGVVGSISRSQLLRRKLSQPVFVCEIRLEAIPLRSGAFCYTPSSTYPPIEADLSFAHEKTATWQTIERFIRGEQLSDLESVRLLDRYEGPGVPEGRIKTTIRLVFRSRERTLEQEKVNGDVARLAGRLQSLDVSLG
jgi:phenylalanyl-tRNA synthetase beta chain